MSSSKDWPFKSQNIIHIHVSGLFCDGPEEAQVELMMLDKENELHCFDMLIDLFFLILLRKDGIASKLLSWI